MKLQLTLLASLLAAAPAIAAGPPAPAAADVVARVLPSVVAIDAFGTVPDVNPGAGGMAVNSRKLRTVHGTGFIVDKSGVALTNKHVVDGADRVLVTFSDNTRARAHVMALANGVDLALVKIDTARPLPTVTFADSDKVRVGDPVLAIGNPLGVGLSVSSGIVSGLNRDIHDTPYDDYIQTDAAINHGNSGGPLLNADGEVIGMDTLIFSSQENGGSIGLGFAIAANCLQFGWQRLFVSGRVMPGWIGVRAQDLTYDLALAAGLDRPSGAIVTGSDPDSPAIDAGLRLGDVITEVDGHPISDSRNLMRAVAVWPLGKPVPLTVRRDGKEMRLDTDVRLWPGDAAAPAPAAGTTIAVGAETTEPMVATGLKLSALTPDAIQTNNLPSGSIGVLVTAVDPESFASTRGLRAGDVIARVQDHAVTAPSEVFDALAKARGEGRALALVLVQQQGGDLRWITLDTGAPGSR